MSGEEAANFDIFSDFVLDNYLFEDINENDFILEVQDTENLRKRFHKSTENEIFDLFEARQSANTKKNTNWGLKIFQGKTKRKTSPKT